MKKKGLNSDILQKSNPLGIDKKKSQHEIRFPAPSDFTESRKGFPGGSGEDDLELLLDMETPRPPSRAQFSGHLNANSPAPPRRSPSSQIRELTPIPFYPNNQRSDSQDAQRRPSSSDTQTPVDFIRPETRKEQETLSFYGSYLNPKESTTDEYKKIRVNSIISGSWNSVLGTGDGKNRQPYEVTSEYPKVSLSNPPKLAAFDTKDAVSTISKLRFSDVCWDNLEKECISTLGPFGSKVLTTSIEQLGFTKETFPRSELESLITKLIASVRMDKRALFVNKIYKAMKSSHRPKTKS